ncbi:MAG TPA: helix-turn-helix domain-containing protein, partial [Anaerolineales bacterium]|nr:helix-turn-helix domain-containing protein [Anaerolineales bacterium]
MWEWKRRLEEEGEEALQARPRPERMRRLSEEQQQCLSELLLQGP